MRCHCPRAQTIVPGEGVPAGSEPVRLENPDPEVPGGAHDPMRDDVDGDGAMVQRVLNLPLEPSARQIDEHELTDAGVAIALRQRVERTHTLPERM